MISIKDSIFFNVMAVAHCETHGMSAPGFIYEQDIEDWPQNVKWEKRYTNNDSYSLECRNFITSVPTRVFETLFLLNTMN